MIQRRKPDLPDTRTPPSPSRRAGPSWWWLAALLIAARCVLLYVSVPAGRAPTGDEPIYDEIARHLLAGEGYTHNGVPWVWKPPGWPILLAGLYAVVGADVQRIAFVQGLFDGGTMLLLAWLGGWIFRSTLAARLTFLALFLWPPLFRESRFMQTEPVFTFTIALTVCAFARFVRSPGMRPALLVGLAAGLAALMRPTGIVLALGLLVGWLLAFRPTAPRSLLHAVTVLLGVALVLSPWTARNWRLFHSFIPVSTGGGELFYMGSTPETDGRWNGPRWLGMAADVLRPVEAKLGRRVDPVERDRAFLAAGIENWKRDPAGSALIAIKRFYRLTFVPVHSDDRPWLRVGFLVAILAVYVLAVPVGLRAWGDRRPERAAPAALFVAVVVFVLASSVFYTNSRYFEPVRAVLLVLAAGALAERIEAMRARAPRTA